MAPDPRRRGRVIDSGLLYVAALAVAVLLGVLFAGMSQFSRLGAGLERQAALSNLAYADHDRLLQSVNEETGVRAYVATGDPAYLQIYYASLRPWSSDTERITQSQAAIPLLQARVRRSFAAAQDVQQYFRDEIALVRGGRVEKAKAAFSRGKRLFDRLRSLDADVQRRADAELTAQRAQTRLLAKAGLGAAIALCAVSVLLFAAFVLLAGRARRYRQRSMRDSLTGVQNRVGAIAAIDSYVGAAVPAEFALLFIDLDGFKKINDAYGHATGDAILKGVASRLQAELRDADVICRLGGDEFVCVLAPPVSPDQTYVIAARLRKALAAPYTLAGDTFVVGCSMGVSLYPQHATTSETLLARADSAMYAAKAAGGGVRVATAVAQW